MMDTNTTNAALTVFHEGQELSNATVWKNRQVLGNHMAALLGAAVVIVQYFGYSVPLNAAQITEIAGLIATLIGVANSLLTLATSRRVGIKPSDTNAHANQ